MNHTHRENLTTKQAAVYKLYAIGNDEGEPPTLEEIGKATGVTRVTVWGHVKALKKKGYLNNVPHKARTYQPVLPIDHRYTADVITQEQARALLTQANLVLSHMNIENEPWLRALQEVVEDIKGGSE